MSRPQSEAELSEIIAGATEPLAIRGGGTRPVGHPVEGRALDCSGLSGVTLYEPGALTLVARAGTPMQEIETVLAESGQRLAFEPMDHRPLLDTTGAPTIGGVVSANVSGPRRVQVGACRDHLLGVRFVDGQGRILKNGGRVMKNVTGYDLVKLMAGARGTLGVLTEVALKVLPASAAEATLERRGLPVEAAIPALAEALGSPFEVTGAAHLGDGDGGARTLIRIEGLADSVAYRSGRLAEMGWHPAAEAEASRDVWQAIRDVMPFALHEGAVWRLSLRPSDAPALVAGLREAGIEHEAIFDCGGGLVWLLTPEEGDAGAAAVRAGIARLGGHATLVRGSEGLRRAVPVFEPEAEPLRRISAGLRARFDPRGLLNPGLMG